MKTTKTCVKMIQRTIGEKAVVVLSSIKILTAVKLIAFRALHWLTHLPQCRIYAPVNRVSIGSDNGLSPIRRQSIILTNAGLLSIGPLRTNVIEILIKIQNFSFTKMHLKITSAKRRPFYPGGDELKGCYNDTLSVPILRTSIACHGYVYIGGNYHEILTLEHHSSRFNDVFFFNFPHAPRSWCLFWQALLFPYTELRASRQATISMRFRLISMVWCVSENIRQPWFR